VRGKVFGLAAAACLPPVMILAVITDGFQRSLLTLSDLIFPVAVLITTYAFVWIRFVTVPVEQFIKTIKRAIDGDYRARFSCSDGNFAMKELSADFNRLMSCVESQTEELTKSRRLQCQLYENEKVYRSALEITCERVLEADLTHNRIIYGNAAYKQTFPFLHTAMFDEMVRLLAEKTVYGEDAEKFYGTFSRNSLLDFFRKAGSSEVMLEYRQKTADGRLRWLSATVVLLKSGENSGLKIIGYVKDIDERKKRDLELLRQSQKDGLTGLYNKTETQSLAEAYLTGEGAGRRHAVVMMDIDNFKRINDTFGHTRGDQALVKVSQVIQEAFRSTDIAGRVGGDEFLVLMKDVEAESALLEKLKTVQRLFQKIRLDGETSPVSGSIGVALYPDDGKTYETLYQKADEALYRSKRNGKNRFSLYGKP
jgi:diguanylate cyclase (GGDEF)-like protein